MKNYINKWTYKRLIQFTVGLYFIWNYFEDGSKFSMVFGGIMLFQSLLNVGCFSSKGCDTNNKDAYNVQPFAKKIKKVKLK